MGRSEGSHIHCLYIRQKKQQQRRKEEKKGKEEKKIVSILFISFAAAQALLTIYLPISFILVTVHTTPPLPRYLGLSSSCVQLVRRKLNQKTQMMSHTAEQTQLRMTSGLRNLFAK